MRFDSDMFMVSTLEVGGLCVFVELQDKVFVCVLLWFEEELYLSMRESVAHGWVSCEIARDVR